MIKYIKLQTFFSDVLKLSVGTIAGRLITILALPLITRLYTPEEFSLLAIYIAFVSTLSIAACLRFDIAIPVVKRSLHAFYLLILSIVSAFFIGITSLLLLYFFQDFLLKAVDLKYQDLFIFSVPIGIFATAVYSTMQNYATRKRKFNILAVTRMYQAIISNSITIIFGLLFSGPWGLIVGSMANNGAGSLQLGIKSLKHEKELFKTCTKKRLYFTFRKFKEYPIYSASESLLNVASLQIPIMLIAAASPVKAGFLFVAMQFVNIPINLIGRSISQVFVSRVREEEENNRLDKFTFNVLMKLTSIGVPVLTVTGLSAPGLCKFIFGADWQDVGAFITLLVPWMVLQFIASPISMIMYAKGRQGLMLVLTSFGFVIRVLPITVLFFIESKAIVEVLVATSMLFYFVCMITFLKVSGLMISMKEMKFFGTLVTAMVGYILAAIMLYG